VGLLGNAGVDSVRVVVYCPEIPERSIVRLPEVPERPGAEQHRYEVTYLKMAGNQSQLSISASAS
jgi:hypothetical protein